MALFLPRPALVRERCLTLILFLAPIGCGSAPMTSPHTVPAPVAETLFVPISEGTGLEAALSPDGRRIAITLLDQAWVMSRDGGAAEAITNVVADPRVDQAITWAPDSRRLAVHSHAGQLRGTELRVVDLESGSVRQVDKPDWVGLNSSAWGVPIPWATNGRQLLRSVPFGDSAGIWAVAVDGESVQRVAEPGRRAGNLAISADGRYLAYAGPVHPMQEAPRPNTDLWEIDLSTGEERALTSDSVLDGYPAYSPDGRLIAFVSERSGSPQLWLMDREDDSVRALTRDSEDVHLAPLTWTPESDAVVFTAAGRVRIATLDGELREIPFTASVPVARWSGLRRPSLPEAGERKRVRGIVSPALSPDGGRVVFGALGDLWIAEVGDVSIRRLTETPRREEVHPVWSPDGERVVYMAGAAGRDPELRLMDVDRPERVRTLPFELPWLDTPMHLPLAWSPDGRRLATIPGRSLSWVDLDTDSTHVVTTFRSWAPDKSILGWTAGGDSIVYSTSEWAIEFSERRKVWKVSADGEGDPEPVAIPGDYTQRAAWTPDLARAAYDTDGVGYVVRLGDPDHRVRLDDPLPRAFSWSADGRWLLYTSGPDLRLRDVESGRTRTLDINPGYTIAEAPTSILIRDVRVLDGTGSPPSVPADVLLEDGRIRTIAAAGSLALPAGTEVVDGGGKTLMPGLINLHAHLMPLRLELPAHVYYGVLSLRNPRGPAEWMQSQREWSESEGRIAPRLLYAPMFFLQTRSGMWHNHEVDPSDPQTLAAQVQAVADIGADFIKPYPQGPGDPQVSAAVIDAALANRLPVTGHFTGGEGFLAAIGRGIQGKEHVQIGGMFGNVTARDDMVRTLQAADVCVTPTLLVGPAGFLRGHSTVMPLDSALLDDPALEVFYPESVLANAREMLRDPPPERQVAVWRLREAAQFDWARKLHRGGVTLATGTDVTEPWEEQGVHLEMELLVREIGMTPVEAIRAATHDAARCLGIEDQVGSVTEGMRADLLLIDGNPAEDIRDTRRIDLIFLGGRMLTREQIVQAAR